MTNVTKALLESLIKGHLHEREIPPFALWAGQHIMETSCLPAASCLHRVPPRELVLARPIQAIYALVGDMLALSGVWLASLATWLFMCCHLWILKRITLLTQTTPPFMPACQHKMGVQTPPLPLLQIFQSVHYVKQLCLSISIGLLVIKT